MQVTIVKQYQDFIDFGLRPEDSRKVSIVTLKNLGVCSLPVCLSVQQVMHFNDSFCLQFVSSLY